MGTAPRALALTAAGVAAASALAACGAGESATKSSSTGSSASSSASAGSGASPEVTAAQAKVADSSKVPTTIGVTTPLKAKPAAGKTFIWMNCDVSQCRDEGDGIKEAAAAAGWNYKEIAYKSADPATLVSGLMDALRQNPGAVGLSGLPQAVWQSAATAYEKAGIPIVIGYVGGGNNVKGPVIGEVGGTFDVSQYGAMIGQWFIADSQAKGNAVLLSVNDFPVLKDFSDSFKKTVSDGCKACSVQEVNATIPQVFSGATVPPLISAIQKDPKIDYVISSNMPFITGLSGALAAANLTGKVKVAGESGDVAALQLIKDGTWQATTGLALHYTGWLFMDMVLRHAEGSTIAEGGGGLPKQLLLKDSTFALSNSFDQPADFREQFKKLWLVG